VVTWEVLDHLAVDELAIEARGPHELKGLASPIDLTRISGRRA
jgi:class 3 adenylate cyclase